jgi:CO/xanthine dehydrogenase FAD-binding subunit
MKPPRFDYLVPRTIDEALGILAEHGEQAKVLAGGQSLVPLLNFRLVRPAHLVDLNEVPGLAGIRAEDGRLAIGAMTRQRAVESSGLVSERCPLLHEAMPLIGHVQIRNRGTIGGSLAHADPAAELPAVVAALEGEVVLQSARGRRVLSAADFFVGYLTTAAEPAELLVEVRLPVMPPRTGSAFLEVSRRHGDFALVGVAATVTLDGAGVCTAARVALTGVGPTPVVARDAVRALVGAPPSPEALEDVARRVAEALRPDSDLHASSEYRKHVGGVLARRALARAAARAVDGARRGQGEGT